MTPMTYFRFFQDLWRFFKNHAEPVSADSWWQRLADQADELANRYGNTEFVIRMTSIVVWEIDRIFQEKEEMKR
ncbi:MAG: hypothetical protein J6S50_00525 [Oscillospiraceae bacterium]|nr:hypothetical protein [Oscillospiraceae bacterium]MBO7726986.1 hypothetical protein [Oscillospiraceae bacterium]